jgi:hypothetical protein
MRIRVSNALADRNIRADVFAVHEIVDTDDAGILNCWGARAASSPESRPGLRTTLKCLGGAVESLCDARLEGLRTRERDLLSQRCEFLGLLA